MDRVRQVETGAWPRSRRGRDEFGTLVHKLGIVFVALTLVVGLGAYFGWTPRLTAPSGTPENATEGPSASGPGLSLERPPKPPAVLTALDSRPAATRRGVERMLAAAATDRSLGRHVGLVVESAGSGRALYKSGGSDLVTPASTLKLLTVAAALATLGPEHRFDTTVVRGRGPRSLVLVGGGDPLLTDRDRGRESASDPRQASLQDLARSTARELRREGVRRVQLGYDASLFSGPSVSPAWEPSYVPDFVVSPITSLWVDEGREVRGQTNRVVDPSAEAAARFARLLGEERITVSGTITQTKAPAAVDLVATVQSRPLDEIAQHALEQSDNEAAEVLLRHTAIAGGRPATFRGGVATVEAALTDLGIDMSRARIYDGSGLSRDDAVPLSVIVDVIQLALSPDHPELRMAAVGLPVAGFTGSLDYRFVDDAADGRGLVRAKTGTLTGVHGLAGLVTTADGELLVFAAVADEVPVVRTLDARAQLDEIASLLAGCGC